MFSEKNKKCNGCKKSMNISSFILDIKEYARCNECRKQATDKYKKNICEICGISAYFNIPELTWGRFCKEHSQLGMVNVKSKSCLNEDCNKIPYFNYNHEKVPLYCKNHSLDNMVNVKDKKCIKKGCNKNPYFNYKGEREGLYCKIHSLDNMVNIKDKKCINKGCDKKPSFNYRGESKAIYCKFHSLEKMVNIKSKKCLHDLCEKSPSFNYKEESLPLYCKKHSLENMVDVKHEKCKKDNCNKNPYFNYEYEKIPLYCKEHSLQYMVDVKHKKCIKENCNKNPCFNYEDEKTPLYCKEHSLTNMIDIKSKRCKYENCESRTKYGYCGQSKTNCSKHKEPLMFKNPKRTCVGNDEEECKDMATYGIKEPIHCEEHSTKDEICLIASKCKKCGRTELLNRENECITFCAPNRLYEEHKTHQKVKEITMIKYLNEFIKSDFKVKDDNIIDTICNLYRPDRMYDCNTHFVIVECDEYQHKNNHFCSSYRDLKHAELSRMHDIQNACGLPCIFLRWNPDNFRVKGILNKNYNNKYRLKILVKWVEKCFTMVPDKEYLIPVKYKYLFYDEYEETDLSFLEIDDTQLTLIN